MANDDFFSFVNKDWLDKIEIPNYLGTYGITEKLEEETEEKIIKILKNKGKETKIGKIVNSVLNNSVQEKNINKIKSLLNEFDYVFNPNDISDKIGLLNRYQLLTPLKITIDHTIYNSNKCLIHLYEPDLGLPIYEYYHKDDSDPVLTEYRNILRKISDKLDSNDLEYIIKIEKEIYKYLSNENDLQNPEKCYNEYTYNKLKKDFDNINWDIMFEKIGISIKNNEIVIVTNINYLNKLNKMFKVFDTKVWSIWFRASCVLSLLMYLPPPFDDYHHHLFGKLLRGKKTKLSQENLLYSVFDNFANNILTNLYIQNIKNAKQIKEQAIIMINGIKNASIRKIKQNKWMSETAKNMAIKKVKFMNFQVGFPDKLHLDYLDDLEISNDNLIENILILSEKDTEINIKKRGNKCLKNREKWNDGVYEVNAYYYTDENKMVVPLGILQPPFFDPKKSVAWNYGGIGAIIGHEITHAFDDDGHYYDHTGSWKGWWTSKDKEHYSNITNKIVELYNNQSYFGGFVNGELTLSENLADIGGLEIAIEAVNNVIKINNIIDENIIKEMYKDFFVSYAVSWRVKDRELTAKHKLLTDHHAPAYYRVNIPVSLFDEFYYAFNITEKDKMYRDKKNRIHMF